MSWLEQLARPEVLALKAYEHAVWEPGLTRLHANELPDELETGLNRYPEPQPRALIERLAGLYGVAPESLLLTRGSDDAIDLLVRAFCRAGLDAVLICPPTFGMYALAAEIQGAHVVRVALAADDGFNLDPKAVLERCAPDVKLVFLCSPNNPTGNLLDAGAMLRIVTGLHERALVVVDEAYIEFSMTSSSLAARLHAHPNLAVLRTLSKAHGLAGLRLGALLGDPGVIAVVGKLAPPYAIARPIHATALGLLNLPKSSEAIEQVCTERERLSEALGRSPRVRQVYPSEANFLLARFQDAEWALGRARAAGLLVRDMRGHLVLGDALRITVGTCAQNDALLKAWA